MKKTIDVHGCTVEEALEIIYNQIDYCVKNNIPNLDVVHGWDHGNKIKTRVLHLTSSFHPALLNVRENIVNNGISTITIKTKLF